MYYRESFQFMEGRDLQSLRRVPKWACDERMQCSVPLKELWKCSDPSEPNNYNRRTGIFSKLRRFGRMKRKHELTCHSAEEMNRRADALIEQGSQVEREAGVLPVQTICFPLYRIVFRK